MRSFTANHPLRSHALVVGQLLGVLLCCIPFDAQEVRFWPVLAFSVLGAMLGLYTLAHNRIGNFSIYPEPADDAKLITSGPYRQIRHPMYTALGLMMFGIALYNYGFWNLAGLAMVWLVINEKAVTEERYLRQLFPKYPDYEIGRARFIPNLF